MSKSAMSRSLFSVSMTMAGVFLPLWAQAADRMADKMDTD